MSELIDQLARTRFVEEINQPFSVIAPAGVGKTQSIIERVSRMLTQSDTPMALVTYTKKAAEEMRGRLENKVLKLGKQMPYERVFIGTIHSLCVELLAKHGVDWGLPAQTEVIANINTLWAQYNEEVINPLCDLPKEIQERYWRYFKKFENTLLMEVEPKICEINEFTTAPIFQFQNLFRADYKGAPKKTQERLQLWAEDFLKLAENEKFIMPELPDPPKEESKVWSLYKEIFGAYENWRALEGMRYAQYLAGKFKEWRRKRGKYFYDDLIEVVREKIKPNYGLSIVLDEAQDTSPEQLELLKKIALEKNGRLQLTMVGDPQQSIYSSRASLPHYLQIYKDLIKNYGAEELTFNVTFRCSQNVVDWVNNLGGSLLEKSPTQAIFVPLQARPGVSRGNVFRLALKSQQSCDEDSVEECDWALAREFAKELKKLNITASELHKVAIIAPQKAWLFKLAMTLRNQSYRVQLHAEGSTASPAERILKAIIHLMVCPYDSFELIGLLRELYIDPDRTVAEIAKKTPEKLTINRAPDFEGLPQPVYNVLQALNKAWELYKNKPLDIAIAGFINEAGIDTKMKALAQVYGEQFYNEWRTEYFRVLSLATPGTTVTKLLAAMDESSSEAPVEPGALQLMTMYKAKGLEWPIVIIPFLHRPNNNHKNSYPVIDPSSNGKALTWKLSSEQTNLASRENFERLLYVAMTRAKEQLILVDDSGFYKKKGMSAAELLGINFGGQFYNNFISLPTPADLELPSNEIVEYTPDPNIAFIENREKILPVFTPSSLVDHALDEEQEGQVSGIDYGEWWHNLWAKMEINRTELLKKARFSKFAERGTKELGQLFDSELWKLISNPENEIIAEEPFLVQLDDRIMEGRVDLIIKTSDKVFIVDWKTDHISMDKLVENYTPQMLSYKKAYEKLLGQPVDVTLYSTVYGLWRKVGDEKSPLSRNLTNSL